MSFQAYMDNIQAKTGKTPEDLKALAEEKGLLKPGTKAGEVVAWLKSDLQLGHGHAMAIYTYFKGDHGKDKSSKLQKHFSGEKEKWRSVFEALLKKLNTFGSDVTTDPVSSYISLLRGEKKFGIVQITKDKMIIGLKLRTHPHTHRFEPSGSWNAMMTHKVFLISSNELDKELYSWLQKAYDVNGGK